MHIHKYTHIHILWGWLSGWSCPSYKLSLVKKLTWLVPLCKIWSDPKHANFVPKRRPYGLTHTHTHKHISGYRWSLYLGRIFFHVPPGPSIPILSAVCVCQTMLYISLFKHVSLWPHFGFTRLPLALQACRSSGLALVDQWGHIPLWVFWEHVKQGSRVIL